MEQLSGHPKVLVVEDEFFLADDLASALRDVGARVAGPVPTPADALAMLEREPDIDAALLDINLRGKLVYEVADLLKARGIPFLFATGYAEIAIPEDMRDVMRVEKPFATRQLLDALGRLGM